MTQTTSRQQVLEIKRTVRDPEALVREWANCHLAEIDHAGDIWIAVPQSGHWLDDADLERFVAWAMRPRRRLHDANRLALSSR